MIVAKVKFISSKKCRQCGVKESNSGYPFLKLIYKVTKEISYICAKCLVENSI